MKKIRVLHVFAPTFGHSFSGDTKLWVRSFQKWSDEQVNHKILFVEKGETVEARAIKSAFGQKDPTNSNRLPRWRRALWAFKLLCLLVLKRRCYDILHVHTDYWGGLLMGPLARLLNRPCVFHSVRNGEDDPTTISQESFGFIKLWCYKRYSQVICISEALKQECLFQGLSADQISMLINAVDSDVFAPLADDYNPVSLKMRLNLPECARIILSVGSVIPRKGTDLLVDAFFLLAKRYPDLYLLLVGPNSKDESSSVDKTFVRGLQRKIKSNGLVDRVLFIGRVDDDASLVEYYRAADIFAFPSRQEGLPNVLLEAMSAGLPIVTTHLPGSTDLIIKDGETGFLIPPDDVIVIKEKLEFLLDNPTEARALSYAARMSAVQNFSFNVWQMRLVSIYSSLLVI
jgi:glycosyltransferase involved in cell wall biosynthesis